MKNIALQQFIICKKKPSTSYTKINCQHWHLDENGDCIPFCKLKNTNVVMQDCMVCSLVKPIVEIKQQDARQSNSLAEQMRQKLPQYNYYRKDVIKEEPKDKSFLEKAAQYAKTEGSQLIEGKVSEEVFEKRKALCMECPRRMNPTPDSEPIGWCATCGCSAKNPRASLSNKLWMPDLVCPLNKFSKEKGEGFNVGDAVNSVKGAVQSVVSLFKSEGNT